MRYLVIALAALVLGACAGGTEEAGPGPGASSKEQSLRQVAEEYGLAKLRGDAVRSYSYFHKSYKAKCSFDEYSAMTVLAKSLLQVDLSKAELRNIKVFVDGDRGRLEGEVYLGGRPLDFLTENSRDWPWLWEDGKWWVTNDKPKPCALSQ